MAGEGFFNKDTLASLDDVDVTSVIPSDGQGLVWDASRGLYVPGDVGGGGGGGGGAMTLIASTTLGADAADITFTGIPGTYKDLLLLGNLRSANATFTDGPAVQVGNAAIDTGSNYRHQWVRQGDSTGSGGSGSATRVLIGDNNCIPATSSDANAMGAFELRLPGYATTGAWRPIHGQAGAMMTSSIRRFVSAYGAWMNTASAIERVRLVTQTGGNWLAGSSVRLYGLT